MEEEIHPWVRNHSNSLRNLSRDEYKIVVVLQQALNLILNRWDRNVVIENQEGKYIITVGENTNALQIEIQNPIRNFKEDILSEAYLKFYQRNLRPEVSMDYINMAEAIIQEATRYEGVTDVQYTASDIADFADCLYDSESYGDSCYHAAQNEFEYFREVRLDSDAQEDS